MAISTVIRRYAILMERKGLGMFASGRDAPREDVPLDAARLASLRAALHAFVSRRVSNPDEVQDLVQEACTRLIRSCQERQVDEPQAYLFRIAANLIADHHRRLKTLQYVSDADEPMARADQEDGKRYVDLREALEAALGELPPRCRQIFIMRRFDEMSTTSVAFKLRITPRMVQKHLGRALEHLYDRLGPLRNGL